MSATVAAGQTQQFTATAKDPRGNVIRGLDFQWSSDTPSAATVDGNGLATAVNQGTARITATMGGVRASASLTVTPPVAAKADFYVAPNGNDAWSGALAVPNAATTDGPLASVARAQIMARTLIRNNPGRPITIMLRAGTYYLPLSSTSPGTLQFTASDSGNANMPVTWENYPGETPIVNGGEPVGKGGLGLTWKNVSGNLWQVQLPSKTQPFEYLFYNGARRLRSRLQSASGVGYYMHGGSCYSTQTKQTVDISLCDLGTFLRVAATIPPTGANATCPATNNQDGSQSKCLDRFQYNPADPVSAWENLNSSGSICGGSANNYPVGDIEIDLFEAWSMEEMRVSCVDTVNHVIYFTGKTPGGSGDSQNYNFFGPVAGHRYVVENTKDAFEAAQTAGQGGLWFLDRSTSPWTLNYLANTGENPNTDSVVIAQLQPVSAIGGSLISATNLSYVTFQGLTFEVDNFVPPPTGFATDENSEATLPEAIDCESCQHVTFDGVTMRRTSASGILFASTSGSSGTPASNNTIQNSAFYDIGDSGIRIGHHPEGNDKPANVVQFTTIQNNIIQGYSRVFADGEGIAQANGHDTTLLHNEINDGYHAGISVCAFGCPGHAANGNHILSQYNHIWNSLQGITSDGGTLYYNVGAVDGSGVGNAILNNLVHDTSDSSVIDIVDGVRVSGSAYGGEGLYLDNQTGGVDVENNVVYNISAHALWMSGGPGPGQPPNKFNNNIVAFAIQSMFDESGAWDQGCGQDAPLQEILTNNIFYFDRTDSSNPPFFVTNGCAYSCGANYNQFQNFQGNLYWRTDGKFASYTKAFHVVTSAPADATTCGGQANPTTKAWTFLTFSQWQGGTPPNGTPPAMDEDTTGTATVNPNFGKTGQPSDFLLSANLVPGFDYTKTNDTILHAGRNNPVIIPPLVPATFPTYTFTSF
jgi:hypothetical protein